MSLSPSQSPWPFKFVRRQFLIIISFATPINKSQGQSLDNVGLYLPKNIFSHGQLYVATSRVKTKERHKFLIHDKDKITSSSTLMLFSRIFNIIGITFIFMSMIKVIIKVYIIFIALFVIHFIFLNLFWHRIFETNLKTHVTFWNFYVFFLFITQVEIALFFD